MQAIFAIAMKDIRLLMRDRVGFFFITIFPAIFGIMFGYIFQGSASGPSEVAIAVFDADRSETSIRFIDRLDALEQITVTAHDSEEAALAAVRAGNMPAALLIEPGFGTSMENPFRGESAAFRCAIDPSRAFVRGIVEGRVQQLAYQSMMDNFSDTEQLTAMIADGRREIRSARDIDPARRLLMETFLTAAQNMVNDGGTPFGTGTGGGAGGGAAFQPVTMSFIPLTREGPRLTSSFQITMPQAFIWALLGCVAGFGMSLVSERTRGTLTRLGAAPITRWHILCAKALACAMVALGVQVMLLVIFVAFFGVHPGSWFNMGIAIACSTLAFVGIAMLLAVFSRSEAASEGAGRAVLLVLALLGGGGLPLAFMPSWMQTLASISPFKWSILAVEGAVWRDYTLSQMLLPAGVLTLIGIGCLTLASVLFGRDPRLA